MVLDLGDQPACDLFPRADDPGPDPAHPLQMWLCATCGLAQLAADPTVAAEPRGAEPAALIAQAAEAVNQVAKAGLLRAGDLVAEYGSPHGGSWLGHLADHGLAVAGDGQEADVVLDCFGMMHAADQAAALAERLARVSPDGVLLLQFHSLTTILKLGQWNALRHGHYAYYSTTALTGMLAGHGFSADMAWQFPLYGGTILLAASRGTGGRQSARGQDAAPRSAVRELLAEDASAGVGDPSALHRLQVDAQSQALALHDWLAAERSAGRKVLGYGAASRAVSLLRHASADKCLLGAVADASPAKRGLRMPGTDIPVIGPEDLIAEQPDRVLLLLADLLPEVRAALPQIEATGGSWVNVETITAASL